MLCKSPICIGVWGFTVAALGINITASDQQPNVNRNELRYVNARSGHELEHAVFWPIRLTEEAPEDVQLDVEFRGNMQRFGQIFYGTPNSHRIAIVLDEIDREQFDLYVDATRDRRIAKADLVNGIGRLRRTTLSAEVAQEGEPPKHYSRSVVFRRGIAGDSLGFATTGFLEGEITLDDRPIKVRRVDGDANGLFADARDRVWLDWNSDGQWDPFSEQFPLAPILRLGERRYGMRSNIAGTEFSMREILGSGTVKLQPGSLQPDARLTEFEVMLLGRDGSAFSASGQDQPITVPVGAYALHTVRFAVEQRTQGKLYRFVFSRDRSPAEDRWHEVGKGEEIVLDPVGSLRLEVTVFDREDVAPGRYVIVRPSLLTETGLILNSSTCKDPKSNRRSAADIYADIALWSQGVKLDIDQAGYG